MEGPIWETTSRAQPYALECHKCLNDLTANHGMLTALLQQIVGFALNNLQYSRLGYFIPNTFALNKTAGNHNVQHKF
jgi:hypothetical protein